jgi:hypothetical protein
VRRNSANGGFCSKCVKTANRQAHMGYSTHLKEPERTSPLRVEPLPAQPNVDRERCVDTRENKNSPSIETDVQAVVSEAHATSGNDQAVGPEKNPGRCWACSKKTGMCPVYSPAAPYCLATSSCACRGLGSGILISFALRTRSCRRRSAVLDGSKKVMPQA